MAQPKSVPRIARPTIKSLADLRDTLRAFTAERDWDQFHSPKNLASALIVEAGELLEHFQWHSSEDSSRLDAQELQEIEEEIADVLFFLVRLADKLNVDLLAASARKLDLNRKKYPVEKARGRSTKYTKL